ncbi:hypothetical protein ABZX30_05665 [Streptomyces sp. NPDC004542]|uniref:hypothetical protein n=1 Tax=Streptomyces sp. NPDC004542 TaxID=3154281 RepID=UPI0033B104E5
MQGHGYAQPVKQPPHVGWLVFLRVLFVVIAFFSFGFFAWVMLLRLAVVTRRSLDWGLFVAVLAADVLSIVLLGSEPGDDIHTPGGYLGLTLLLGALVAAAAYYLAADIRHFHRLDRAFRAQRPVAAYGYPQPQPQPQPQPPFTAATAPRTPQSPHTPPPMPHTPLPRPPIPTPPPPQRPAPARIEQVRAELDELSDYLRHHDGNPEGGR